jgi:predicted amidohydrolase YtcJ
MEDALDAYTLGSAKAVGRADELGTLEPGKWADFAVFDHDLLSIAPQSLPEAHCLATYIAGQPIFTAGVG